MADDTPTRCDFYADKLVDRFEETIPADPRHIDQVVGRILAVTREMGCAEGKEFEAETALREALANAIIHGAREDPTKSVHVSAACDEERGMLIVVRDPGEGFDPRSVPSPIVGKNLYSDRGRGIFLINLLMDEVRFEKGGTEIHMLKR